MTREKHHPQESGAYKPETSKMQLSVVQDKTSFLEKKSHPWISLGFFIGLLLMWELICRMEYVPPLFLPAPSNILLEGWIMVKSGLLFKHLITSLGSNRANIIRKVLLPAALPMIFAGMKLGIGIALLLVVASEMVAADRGLGFMILHAADLMNTKRLMVGLICLSCLGLFFNWLFVKLEAVCIPWKE